LGKPPSREVMQAAARAARQEMMQRVRDNRASKSAQGGPDQPRGNRGGAPRPQRPRLEQPQAEAGDAAALNTDDQSADGAPGPRPGRNNRNRRRGRLGTGQNMPAPRHPQQQQQQPQPRTTRDFGFDDDDDRDLDHLPRHIDPLQTNLHGRRNTPRGPSHGAVGQPDPMRTSIDLMGKNGGGAGRNKRKGGGRGNYGSGGGYGR
ncbi:MAG: RNA helicase, partial [Burkholderiaceae bacterium]|jgi:ATP-dependent RNA helicase RhlE|nr:RNA helicase [Burkholderiaceae bacterium]